MKTSFFITLILFLGYQLTAQGFFKVQEPEDLSFLASVKNINMQALEISNEICGEGFTAHPGELHDAIRGWEFKDRQMAFRGTVYEPVRCTSYGETARHVWVDWTTGARVDDSALVQDLFTVFYLLEGLTPEELQGRANKFAEMAERRRQDEAAFREISRDATIIDVTNEIFTRYVSSGTDPSAFFDLDFFSKLYESAERMRRLYGETEPMTPEALRNRFNDDRKRSLLTSFGPDLSIMEDADSFSELVYLYNQKRGIPDFIDIEPTDMSDVREFLDDLDNQIMEQSTSLGWSLFTRLENTGEVAKNSAEFSLLNRSAYAYARMIEGIYRKGANATLESADDVIPLLDLLPQHHDFTIQLLKRYRHEFERQSGMLSGSLMRLKSLIGVNNIQDIYDRADQAIYDVYKMQEMDEQHIQLALVSIELQINSSLKEYSSSQIESKTEETSRDELNKSQSLTKAVQSGQSDRVKLLLDQGIDPNSKDFSDGMTPLEWALDLGQVNITQMLLQAGADPSSAEYLCSSVSGELQWLLTEYGACSDPSLLEALMDGNEQLFYRLLEQGSDPNENKDGLSPLQWAFLNEDIEIIRHLCHAGADPDLDEINYLGDAVSNESLQIIELLIDECAVDLNQAGDAIFFLAIENPELMTLLVQHGAIVPDYILKEAIDFCAVETVILLREIGTPMPKDIDYDYLCDSMYEVLKDFVTISPDLDLERGCEAYDYHRVSRALDARPSINGLLKNIDCAFEALELGREDVVTAFLDAGLTLESAPFKYFEDYICSRNYDPSPDIVIRLLDSGIPSTSFPGEAGPLSCLVKEGRIELVAALLNAGVDPNETDQEMRTPLMWAASLGHLEIVEALIDVGASSQVTDNQGKDALAYASEKSSIHSSEQLSRKAMIEDRIKIARGPEVKTIDIFGPLKEAIVVTDEEIRLKKAEEAARLRAEEEERIRRQAELRARAEAEARARAQRIQPPPPVYIPPPRNPNQPPQKRRNDQKTAPCNEAPSPPPLSLFPPQVQGLIGKRYGRGESPITFQYKQKQDPVMVVEVYTGMGGPRTLEAVRSDYLRRGTRIINIGGWPVSVSNVGTQFQFATNKGNFAISIKIYDKIPSSRRQALADAALKIILKRIPMPCP